MADMRLESYTEKYHHGVIECLRRNFGWMGEATEDEVSGWASPILSYKWSAETDVTDDEYKYRHGAVLLDGERVVGYFGMILARRGDGSSSYLLGSPTTWVIDEDYRFHFFDIVGKILDDSVRWIELTPRKSVAESLKKLYGFEHFGFKQFRLIPFPVEKDDYEVNLVKNASEIRDEIIKREFVDHSTLSGIRLIRIICKQTNEESFVFYKVFDEDSTRIRILKITDPVMFAKGCSEIIWKIYKSEFYPDLGGSDVLVKIMDGLYNREKLCVECDDFLLKGQELVHALIKEKDVTRLCRLMNANEDIDLLYTESALLDYRI